MKWGFHCSCGGDRAREGGGCSMNKKNNHNDKEISTKLEGRAEEIAISD